MNKKSLPLLAVSLVMAGALSGCIVEPAPVAVAPPGVVYVAPAVGYSWRYYPDHGWGWWHPHEGWRGGWHRR